LSAYKADSDGTFLERAFPTYLASNRDVGIQIHGAFGKPGYTAESVPGPIDTKNFLTYQIGVDNGSGDDGSPNNEGKASYDSKEFVGAYFFTPVSTHEYSLRGIRSWLSRFIWRFKCPNTQRSSNTFRKNKIP